MKTPQWLRSREPELEELPPIPQLATLPLPSMVEPRIVDDETKLKVISQAHHIVEQIKAERAADKTEIGRLMGEQAELVLLVESEKKKSATLELDIAEHQNTIATLQSQVQEFRQLLSLQRRLMDRWEIKAPPKKDRKPKPRPTIEKVPANGR